MSQTKNSLILLLTLTTAGGAALAWHQYHELLELRAAAMDPKERADLQKRLWGLQKDNRALQDRIAALESRKSHKEEAVAEEKDGQPQGPEGPGGGGRFVPRFVAIRELMAKPEVQAMMANERKGAIDMNYAPLFKMLNLSPDQSGKLTQLLAERQSAIQDVFMAARDQGINPRDDPDGFHQLVTDAEAPINDSIKSLLGDTGYSQLNNYEQTMPQRNVVNTLQQRLSYTDSPLSSSQADQLVQILAANAPPRANNGSNGMQYFGNETRMLMGPGGVMMGGGGGMGGLVGPGSAPITSGAVNQASTVLTQPQLSTLQQMQQQQQTAQQLQQMMRSSFQQNNYSGGPAVGGAPPPGPHKGGG